MAASSAASGFRSASDPSCFFLRSLIEISLGVGIAPLLPPTVSVIISAGEGPARDLLFLTALATGVPGLVSFSESAELKPSSDRGEYECRPLSIESLSCTRDRLWCFLELIEPARGICIPTETPSSDDGLNVPPSTVPASFRAVSAQLGSGYTSVLEDCLSCTITVNHLCYQ